MLFNWKLFPGTNLQDLNLDWIINFVKMIPSRLPKFSDHHTWLVYDYSTGEYYDSGEPTGGAGEPGEPGKSPIIGINGNWYTWNTTSEAYVDTGTKAQGVQGEQGAGVATGGTIGNVLVKRSSADYETEWTANPELLKNFANIEYTTTSANAYTITDYLIFNGVMYKVIAAIATGDTLQDGVNIQAENFNAYRKFSVGSDVIVNTDLGNPSSAITNVWKSNGVVVFELRITNANNATTYSTSTPIFTLPAGYRPPTNVLLPAAVNTNDTTSTVNSYMVIHANGTINTTFSGAYKNIYFCGTFPLY